jgi:hypothetical protein
MRRLAPLLFLVACAVDNEFTVKDDHAGGDTGGTGEPPIDEDGDGEVDEACNGVDDDGDGEIDEGFSDADGNGRADCLDNVCPELDAGAAGDIAIVEECTGTSGSGGGTVSDPWNVRTKWTFSAPAADATAVNSYAQPVIGNLDDDDGDGDIDADDSPEVVIVAFGARGYIVAIDGATGIEKWSYPNASMSGGVLIADIDSDGYPDVVGYEASGRPVALEGDGTRKWQAPRAPSSTSYPLVSVADLDGDGNPEVIADDLILNGEDGSVAFSLNADTSNPYRIAAVADMDLDGDQEIFLAGTAYDSDGSTLWTTRERGTYGFWPIVLQADSDPEAEIGFVGENWSLWDDDGTQLYSVRYGSSAQPGPPCAGDFDGDGETEVAWPAYQTLVMYEIDGTPVWSVPMNDTSGLAGCSGWDVDGDGALEVLFADEDSLTIFDGATGAERYTERQHRSGTVFEYPTVADIDDDEHAEILFVSNYGAPWGVLKVIEHAGDGWPAAGSTWAVHDFAMTNVLPDGSVPASPDPYWTEFNVYRARVASDEPGTPDLVATITDVCLADCDFGPVQVSVQVSNQGGVGVDPGAVVSLYANDRPDRLVGTKVLPAIAPGRKLAGVTFELLPEDVGRDGFLAVIDDDGTGVGVIDECDESNNEDDYTDVECP